MTSCSPFSVKNGKFLNAARMFSFEIKSNRKAPNGITLNALQNGYLGFFILTPKIQIINFSKIIAIQSTALKLSIKKTEYMRSRYIRTTRIQNCKAISLFLAVQWSKNQVYVNDVTFFEMQFLAFLIVVHKSK